MNDATHQTGLSRAKVELRDRIIEELRVDTEGTIDQRKRRVAAKLGISKRWLNMALNLTPHWTGEREKAARKQLHEQQRQQLSARGVIPGHR